MASTRKAIRREIGERYGLSRLLTTTSAGAVGGTTFVVSGEADADQSANAFNNRWSYSTDQDQERRIRLGGFAGATGTFTVSPGFSAQVASAKDIEVWDYFRPSEVHAAINRALQYSVGRRVKDTSITLDQTSVRYQLPSWVRNEDDVLEVYYIAGDNSKFYEIEVPWWKVRPSESAGVRIFQLHLYPPLPSAYTLVLLADKYYDAISTEAATTEAPLEWVAARAAVELLRSRLRRITSEEDRGLQAVFQQALQDERRWRGEYFPEFPRRVMPETPFNLYEDTWYPPF